jgi:hypothetical protein
MKISDVFTPRTTTVNLKTYVPRSELELALSRSIQGSLHSVLFGESGNGKSWLYRKVFEGNGYHYKVANCANACRAKSVAGEIYKALMPKGFVQKTGYNETKEATAKAVFLDGKISHQGQYKVDDVDQLYVALSTFRKQIGLGDAVVVLENLEAIVDDADLMDELANILLLLDDPIYGDFKIKFLLVGVPNGVLELFAKTKNVESVANRLHELPKVGGLTLPMVETLVDKGFNDLLKYNLPSASKTEIAAHIHRVTLGVAQRAQEYCEHLAYALEDARLIYSNERLKEADKAWLSGGLRQAYTAIESHLNSKQTTIARRNQVIYCIGYMTSHQIDSISIAEKIKANFPSTAKENNMGIAGILADLAASEMPLLRKNPKTKDFRVADPRYLMCIRVMLYINPVSRAVEKKAFKH